MTEAALGGLSARIASDGASCQPEKKEVGLGFMPLADCASAVMPSILGFDRKDGIRIVPTRGASWGWDAHAPRGCADASGVRHSRSVGAAPRVVVVHAESRACQ